MRMDSRIMFFSLRRPLRVGLTLLSILAALGVTAHAQQTTTPQNTQGALPPQPPGGPQDGGVPVVIGERGSMISGAAPTFTVLNRDPNELEHATDPETGRNFHWDQDTSTWVDSTTGKGYHLAGYVCSTSGPLSAPTATVTPQPPG